MYSDPLAYLLTWTCHGTWLHGDERGSVDDVHNSHNTPTLPPNDGVWSNRSAFLTRPPLTLTTQQRATVRESIEAHCAHRRWTVLALNPRSNHVHAVIAAPHVPPEKVMQELKAWATRFMRRAAPDLIDPWTAGGSTKYLFNQESVDAAIQYVQVEQDRLDRFVLPPSLNAGRPPRQSLLD